MYFNLYPDCKLVEGVYFSAIYDLARKKIYRFPTAYVAVLHALESSTISQLVSNENENFSKTSQFIDFLFKKDLGYQTERPNFFPKMSDEYDIKNVPMNAIIDIQDNIHDFSKIINDLNELGCEFIQVRSYSDILRIEHLENFCKLTSNTSIKSIELIIKYSRAVSENELLIFLQNNNIISNIKVHSSPFQRTDKKIAEDGPDIKVFQRVIQYSTSIIISEKDCGIINLSTIQTPTTKIFTEFTKCNGCLNNKVSIDKMGIIKNCPAMQSGFGNIKNTRLTTVFKSHNFQKPWSVHKDLIDVCKQCEFRYACSDCRAFTENNSELGKPSKCNYDPTTGIWSATT